eukprot:GILK01009171.1.p1 GENE.GILK01009171.1~~GILK01009171.1.p1  ORF type:complete len:173 (+),score=35.06 GILK01009171.1:45-563(+)
MSLADHLVSNGVEERTALIVSRTESLMASLKKLAVSCRSELSSWNALRDETSELPTMALDVKNLRNKIEVMIKRLRTLEDDVETLEDAKTATENASWYQRKLEEVQQYEDTRRQQLADMLNSSASASSKTHSTATSVSPPRHLQQTTSSLETIELPPDTPEDLDDFYSDVRS